MSQPEQLLAALPRVDVAADAAIAAKAAVGVEHRLAANRQPHGATVAGGPLHLEVAKWLVALELRAVACPVFLGQIERWLIPTPAPEVGLRGKTGLVAKAARHEGKAKFAILLPVPVGRERRRASKAFLAFLERLLGPFARGDVLAHAPSALEDSGFIEDWLPAGFVNEAAEVIVYQS